MWDELDRASSEGGFELPPSSFKESIRKPRLARACACRLTVHALPHTCTSQHECGRAVCSFLSRYESERGDGAGWRRARHVLSAGVSATSSECARRGRACVRGACVVCETVSTDTVRPPPLHPSQGGPSLTVTHTNRGAALPYPALPIEGSSGTAPGLSHTLFLSPRLPV
eukprot:4225555-Pleurochrysis_carterae.AAC.1